MKTDSKADMKDRLFFEHFVPITESISDQEDFMIEGVAINETTTSNGHKFISEELKKAAPSLINVPLLKDHINSVDSIVGRVREARFDDMNKNIPFKAKVNDTKMRTLIQRGDLNTVSVGASVDPNDIEELEDGTIIPHNIQFKELSMVAVPADEGATFSISLKESFKKWKESYSSQDDNQLNRRKDEMTEEQETQSPEVTTETKEEKTETEEKTEEKDLDEKIKEAELKLKKLKLAELEKKIKEQETTEEQKEPETEEPEETEEPVEESTKGYKILKGAGSIKGSSFSIIREDYRKLLVDKSKYPELYN